MSLESMRLEDEHLFNAVFRIVFIFRGCSSIVGYTSVQKIGTTTEGSGSVQILSVIFKWFLTVSCDEMNTDNKRRFEIIDFVICWTDHSERVHTCPIRHRSVKNRPSPDENRSLTIICCSGQSSGGSARTRIGRVWKDFKVKRATRTLVAQPRGWTVPHWVFLKWKIVRDNCNHWQQINVD